MGYRADPALSQAVRVGAIAPTGHRALRTQGTAVTKAQLIAFRGVQVRYQDTAGESYWTDLVFEDTENDNVRIAIDTGNG